MIQLLQKTNMLDFAADIYRLTVPTRSAEMQTRRARVIEHLTTFR